MVRLDPDHAVMPNLVIIWGRSSQHETVVPEREDIARFVDRS